MSKPKTLTEAVEFLTDCRDKGCLGDGDAHAVVMVLTALAAYRDAFHHLDRAADDAADLFAVIDSDTLDHRAEALTEKQAEAWRMIPTTLRK